MTNLSERVLTHLLWCGLAVALQSAHALAQSNPVGQAMTGEFKDGRGKFFGEESLNGRAIFARFVFSTSRQRRSDSSRHSRTMGASSSI